MLTPKQNFIETVRGGNPDRFVKQFEFVAMPYSDPFNATNNYPIEPIEEGLPDLWGVTWCWPEGTPGAFPLHGDGLTVLPGDDIENWRDYVKAPPLEYSEELWQAAEADYATYDRDEVLVGPIMFPGLFEHLHALMGMEDALCAMYENPDEVHEIIEQALDWEIDYLKQMAKRLHPDAVVHHDDWGSAKSTFFSTDMFEEFFLDPYKRLYKAYHDNGYEFVIHHSDSYAATFVPYMIEIGVDVWQGGTDLNDIPALVKQYGGQISFLTGIDNSICDVEDWTPELVANRVREMCEKCGKQYFMPCQTAQMTESTYDGVYEAADKAIDMMSAEMF